MYSLYCVMPGKLELCENYESIEDAVVEMVTMWPEHGGEPRPMVLHDADNTPVVTFAPVGTDRVIVVNFRSGDVDDYREICYRVVNGGQYETHCIKNAQPIVRKHI
jgi:hypothetical protein